MAVGETDCFKEVMVSPEKFAVVIGSNDLLFHSIKVGQCVSSYSFVNVVCIIRFTDAKKFEQF